MCLRFWESCSIYVVRLWINDHTNLSSLSGPDLVEGRVGSWPGALTKRGPPTNFEHDFFLLCIV